MIDLKVFRELCRKAANESDPQKLEVIVRQMKVLLGNDDELPPLPGKEVK